MKEVFLTGILRDDGKTELKFKAIRYDRDENDYGRGHYFEIGEEIQFEQHGTHYIDGRYNGKTASDFESVCIDFIEVNYRVVKGSVKVV